MHRKYLSKILKFENSIRRKYYFSLSDKKKLQFLKIVFHPFPIANTQNINEKSIKRTLNLARKYVISLK